MHLNWAQNSVKISPECINFSQKFLKKFLGRRHSIDQGASEIGLLTESSTATAQSAQCNVPVAASSSIGKRPRSKTLKAVPKKSAYARNFLDKWTTQFKWLHYDKNKNAAFFVQCTDTV